MILQILVQEDPADTANVNRIHIADVPSGEKGDLA